MQVTEECPLQQGVLQRWSVTGQDDSVTPGPWKVSGDIAVPLFSSQLLLQNSNVLLQRSFNLETTATVSKSKEVRKESGVYSITSAL